MSPSAAFVAALLIGGALGISIKASFATARTETQKIALSIFSIALAICLFFLIAKQLEEEDNYTVMQIITGTITGIILSSWLYFHFLREHDERQEARFKFLTYVIGVCGIVYLAQSYAPVWLKVATSFEIGGLLKLTMPNARVPHQDMFLGSGSTPGRAVAVGGDQSGVIALGQIIAIAGEGANATSTLAGQVRADATISRPERGLAAREMTFAQRGVIARDALFTVYLGSKGARNDFFQYLRNINDGWANEYSKNFDFFKHLVAPLRCVEAAASELRDFRLLLFDTERAIRWFQALATVDNPLRPIGSQNEGVAGNNFERDWQAIILANRSTVERARGAVTATELCGPSFNPFSQSFRELEKTMYGDDLRSIQHAPYATIAAAELFHGIRGTESALALMARWLERRLIMTTASNGPIIQRAAENWLDARMIFFINARIPRDLVDIGNPIFAHMLDSVDRDMEFFLGKMTDWLQSAECSASGRGASSEERLFLTVEQELRHALVALRLWAFRARAALHRTLLEHRLRDFGITPALVEQARQYAAMRTDCFPLVANASLHHLVGSAHLLHAELLRVPIERGMRDALRDEERRRLEEARAAYRSALSWLRRHADSEEGGFFDVYTARSAGAAAGAQAARSRERLLLEGGPASEELRMAERGISWVDSALQGR